MKRALKVLLFGQLALVSLQLPIRAWIIDTVLLRDVFLVVAVGFWLLWTVTHIPRRPRINAIDVAMLVYVGYGTVALVALYMSQDVLGRPTSPDPAAFLQQFETYFLPMALFFVARAAMTTARDVRHLALFFTVLAAVLVVDVVGEFVWIRMLGLPSGRIPWYAWVFQHDVRIIGNTTGDTPVFGASSPLLFSSIIGLFGWSHYTAPAVSALTLFVYASGRDAGAVQPQERIRGLGVLRNAVLIGGPVALLMMGVRAPFIALVAGYLLVSGGKHLLRAFAVAGVLVLIVLGIAPLRDAVIRSYVEGFVGYESIGISSLQAIWMFSGIYGLGDSPSIGRVLFGDLDIRNRDIGELRVWHYAVSFGFLWLAIVLVIFVLGLWYCRKLMRHGDGDLRGVAGRAVFGLLFVYLIEIVHYGSTMTHPHADYWAAGLGVISAIASGALQPQGTEVSGRGEAGPVGAAETGS